MCVCVCVWGGGGGRCDGLNWMTMSTKAGNCWVEKGTPGTLGAMTVGRAHFLAMISVTIFRKLRPPAGRYAARTMLRVLPVLYCLRIL